MAFDKGGSSQPHAGWRSIVQVDVRLVNVDISSQQATKQTTSFHICEYYVKIHAFVYNGDKFLCHLAVIFDHRPFLLEPAAQITRSNIPR
jgi:hypothetical protein